MEWPNFNIAKSTCESHFVVEPNRKISIAPAHPWKLLIITRSLEHKTFCSEKAVPKYLENDHFYVIKLIGKETGQDEAVNDKHNQKPC